MGKPESLELAEPQLHIEQFDSGHIIAMVAVGILDAAAYYRGPYEGGALFLLIPELSIPAADPRPPNLQITSDFTSFVSAYACDHKSAFESFVRQKGYSCRLIGDRTGQALFLGQDGVKREHDRH